MISLRLVKMTLFTTFSSLSLSGDLVVKVNSSSAEEEEGTSTSLTPVAQHSLKESLITKMPNVNCKKVLVIACFCT